ncbi:MAG: HAMP domain-containing sensor histidine kinase [Mariprofundus sp.]|nr:HAMP domain-containing sensor histidine kinase [Mariprofundus sp.]
MRHKLYLQIYFAFLGGLLLFALLAGITWKVMGDSDENRHFESGLSLLLTEALPEHAAIEKSKQTMLKLAAEFNVKLSLYSRDNRHLISTSSRLPLPKEQVKSGWNHSREGGQFVLRLSDGRWLVASHRDTRFPGAIVVILLLLGVLGLAAYPLSKRLTCRLEHLQKQVDAFGQGDLKARAQIKGKDEIAALAKRFNHTADRIEKLIEAQKHMLSGASHELRSPLTRMRMTIELMQEASISETKQKLEADILELDNLVDELLLSSKLDAGSAVKPFEQIDLLALAAEVASHFQADVSGKPIIIAGDEQMLRRLLRNLLENAARYAVKAPVSIAVSGSTDCALIRVCDDGPGIPASEQEQIFEPFYQARTGNQSHGSIGLGLALVRKIAHQHHGDVRYISENTHGACFEVSIKPE